MRSGTEKLRSLVETSGDALPLDRALLVAATTEYPDLDPSAYVRTLDELGECAHVALAQEGDVRIALQRVLFGASGFRANRQNYEDPRNNLFNEVLDRRLGIPITLAAAYLEVGRRVGADVHGIGFPGHFLVAQEVSGRRYLLDPFDGGSELELRDCERLLRRSGRRGRVEPWMLAPTSTRKMVARVLLNLKKSYVVRRDYVGAISAIDRLLEVDGSRWSEIRDRGLLYAEVGCARAAARDLLAYVPHASASEASAIEAYLPRLRREERLLH